MTFYLFDNIFEKDDPNGFDTPEECFRYFYEMYWSDFIRYQSDLKLCFKEKNFQDANYYLQRLGQCSQNLRSLKSAKVVYQDSREVPIQELCQFP